MPSTDVRQFSESTRRALEEAAYELIHRDGFEGTTAAAIAHQAGFTERTFFRYFREKQDVVFSPLESRFDDHLPHLRRHVGGSGLSVDSLLNAFTDTNAACVARREALFRSFELIRTNPGLERRLAYHHQWFTDRTVEAVADILDQDPEELSARVIVAVAVTILTTASNHWLETGRQTPLDDLVREARRLAEDGIAGTGALGVA